LFQEKKSLVHEALCDNVDTRSALESMHELIRHTNIYIQEKKKSQLEYDRHLLSQIRSYILKILNIFGANFSKPMPSQGANENIHDFEKKIMPYLRVMSDFRDVVRKRAIEIKETVILKECDEVRNARLPDLGVRLEDREDGKAVIKFEDPEVLKEEKMKQLKLLEKTKHAKEEAKRKLEAQKAEKEAAKKNITS